MFTRADALPYMDADLNYRFTVRSPAILNLASYRYVTSENDNLRIPFLGLDGVPFYDTFGRKAHHACSLSPMSQPCVWIVIRLFLTWASYRFETP